jgi:hypothetical protein
MMPKSTKKWVRPISRPKESTEKWRLQSADRATTFTNFSASAQIENRDPEQEDALRREEFLPIEGSGNRLLNQ